MNIVSSLFCMLCVVILFVCVIIAIIGGLYVINVEIKELFGIDVAKEIIGRSKNASVEDGDIQKGVHNKRI